MAHVLSYDFGSSLLSHGQFECYVHFFRCPLLGRGCCKVSRIISKNHELLQSSPCLSWSESQTSFRRSCENLLPKINTYNFYHFWTIFAKTYHSVAKGLGLLAFCPFYVLYVFRKSRPSQSNSFTFSFINRRNVAWIPIFTSDCPSYSALLKTR